jgi:sarcosine oxidase subunit alpha
MKSPQRKQLVGLRTHDHAVVLEEGAQLVDAQGLRPPMKPIGHVSSSYRSAALGHSIALAMVAGGRARIGQTLYVPTPAGDIVVTVTSPVFHDPEGVRLHA